jgi:hypothetical protein
MTERLANTTTTAQAVEELKSLLTKYMGRTKDGDDGSVSVLKSQFNSPIEIPLHSAQRSDLQHTLKTETLGKTRRGS